ncbi:DUF6476 family protein [Parvularcula maris]|uniref:DUF6476 family protein n=1 Tax=Parvularcula maris TaxID=2965077 RepID=A0A9X2L6Q2_9PROT|nr:DUF6476 family protein [Parvularcula maris]MCQ8184144.1 DUF6476 family protein [Parvularcula maris]
MENEPAAPPAPSHAAAKGLALGLGVLLLGGTALLIALLVTRESETQVRDIPRIELGEGERVVSVSSDDGVLTLLVETTTNQQRIIVLDSATGRRTEVEVHTP